MSAFVTKPSVGKSFTNEIRAISLKNQAIIDEEYMEELKEAFVLFDSDHNGSIDIRELKAAIRALGYETTKKECIEMFKEVDVDPSLALGFD
jgi:Ca2+-binding EF-hand superfamily protein